MVDVSARFPPLAVSLALVNQMLVVREVLMVYATWWSYKRDSVQEVDCQLRQRSN
jgi:hypothetical protein